MVEDARFEDGGARPMALRAIEPDDLKVLSALVQDAIFPVLEMTWDRPRRRFAILLNRFRWEEDRGRNPTPERVQSVLVIEDVLSVVTQGVTRDDADLVLSVLALQWTPGDDGMGRLTLVFAGDGAVALDVETLEVTLRDVTRPYVAVSGKAPDHPE